MADDSAYRGVIGAFPYAFRASDSRLFRSYVLISAIAVGILAVVFVLALVRLMGATSSVQGGSFTLSRAFFVLVGLFVIAPLIAPTLLVARSRRRGINRKPGYESALAVAGYVFLGSLYVGAVAAVPSGLQQSDPGMIGDALYALPRSAGAVFPIIGALLIVGVHLLRR